VRLVGEKEAIVTGELAVTREAAAQFNRLVGSDALKAGTEIAKLRSVVRIAIT
jgi:hypothetical protein